MAMELTLCTVPKPFVGHIDIIQRNALQSWKLLYPGCEVLLFGNEYGSAEVAQTLGLRHIPSISCNEYGTPLINDLFAQARRLASNDIICYANADIILMQDFLQAIEQVAHRQRRFLIVGQRWDIDITTQLNFEPGWEAQLRLDIARRGQPHGIWGIDYFVFRRRFWETIPIPPFAVGRPGWDNWVLYAARIHGARLIDVSQIVTAVHQNHNYAHNPQGRKGIFHGPEAQRNRELMNHKAFFTLQDATDLLMSDGLKSSLNPKAVRQRLQIISSRHYLAMRWHGRVRRYLQTLPLIYPYTETPINILLDSLRKIRFVLKLIGFNFFEV